MGKLNICILGNETKSDCDLWIKACSKLEDAVNFAMVDLCSWDWLDKLRHVRYDLYLAKPGGLTHGFKQLYDERLTIICSVLGYKVFPNLTEVQIYENKRYLSYWLEANSIPHPRTWVFYSKAEALDFCTTCEYPLVAKSSIGASGRGVSIISDLLQAKAYIRGAFSSVGNRRRWYPDVSKGSLIPRIKRFLNNIEYRKQKLQAYRSIRNDPQRGFTIFQEYIPHEFEWRVVRIGDSYFAHKKIKKGAKASGTLLKSYENPPLDILDFVKMITDKHRLFSQSVDIFESPSGYLVNEMQCFFGQSDPYQMLVDNIPGRYVYRGGWVFEAGDFNTNESYDLRLEAAISLVEGK